MRRRYFSAIVEVALLATLACAGPAGKEGPAGPPGDAGTQGPPGTPGTQGAIDYNVMTAQEREDSKMAAQLTGITIPADGRPVLNLKVTERHGSGVKGMSPSVVSWRFALIKLDPAGSGTAATYANDNWVSYMAANDHSTASTETATTSGLTDNGDGTYVYRFIKVITAGLTGAGTTYEPAKTHRVVVLLSASGNPFTPVNIVKDFVPSTGADLTGQNDKVDPAACLECHTTFRAIAGGTGEFGGGEFHGGARFDVHTCSACHNDQKRFGAGSHASDVDYPAVTANATADGGVWTGDLIVHNDQAVLNFPVFIHKIHMGEGLTQTGGTYQGVNQPYETTYPQDVRNCVKCHRSPAAPMADHWKTAPSRRACGACHDDRSFVSPAPPGRKMHTGGAQANDSSCLLCHAEGASAGVPLNHVPVSDPNPNNIYANPTSGSSNTNAAYVAAAGVVPPPNGAQRAKVITYEVNSVSLVGNQPQIVFRLMIADPTANPPVPATPVVFPAPGSATELIPNFIGSPSVYFAFAVPQDGHAAPADFNATVSGYVRNIWNGTATGTGAGTLTGPDANGFYTIRLTGVTIPTGTNGATMLTGGVGYTYSLGSPTTFSNHVLPLTQIDLSRYLFTPNLAPAVSPTGIGGLIVPAPDVWKLATGGFRGRRADPADSSGAPRNIVDNTKCAGCHVTLGVGPDFHAGQRNDATSCNFCHTPNRTSSGWSANQKDFVHSIHGAEKRQQRFTWHEKSNSDGYWKTTYPAVLNRCEMCHLPGTYDFSSASTTAALPNMLFSTVGQGTYPANTPNSEHSPYVSEGTDYGAGFSFSASAGTSTQAAGTTLVISPIVAACSACHDSDTAVDHMRTNGGSFWEARSTALTKPLGEQCLICHGPNRIASISLVHTDKTP